MNGFDRAQAAYDSAEPFAYTAAQEDEIESRVGLILREVAKAAEDIVYNCCDLDDDELTEVARESAIQRLKEIA